MKYLFILIALLTLSCSKKWEAPKGTGCSSDFAKDAVEQASKERNNIYKSGERAIFTGNPSILLTNLVLRENKLYLTTNLVNDKKTVCIKGNSPMGIKFSNGDIYVFDGKHQTSCKIVNDPVKDIGALGIFEITINSLFMKRILTEKPTLITLKVESGFEPFIPIDEENANSLQNSFRCAFEALGGSYDLTDELVLVNNELEYLQNLEKTKN